jgi:hypothetical protein
MWLSFPVRLSSGDSAVSAGSGWSVDTVRAAGIGRLGTGPPPVAGVALAAGVRPAAGVPPARRPGPTGCAPLPAAESRWAAWAAAARRRAAFLPEDFPPAEVPAGGPAGAGGASSAAVSRSRDTSLARIAALTDIFAPVITLARRSAARHPPPPGSRPAGQVP